LFNPKDPADLSKKIDIAVGNKNLAEDLIKRGKIRAKQFTWDKSANIIYQAYSKL